MPNIPETENGLIMLKKELSKLEGSYTSGIVMPDEIATLIEQAKQLKLSLEKNQEVLTSRTGFIHCPVCQENTLNPEVRGKILGIIPDKWLICSGCGAAFDKKLDKAVLIRVQKDPYGIYREYGNRTLTLEGWNEIGLSRLKREVSDLEKRLSEIESKLEIWLLKEFSEMKFKVIAADMNSFLFKEGEEPIFATPAEIIEERKKGLCRDQLLEA